MKTHASPSRLLALPLFVLAALLVACSSNASSAPSSTNTPTIPASPTAVPSAPTPTPDDCPISTAVCDLAAELEERLDSGDYSGIAGRFSPRPMACPVQVPTGPLLCEGVPDGVSTDAFLLARRYSEGIFTHLGGVADSIAGFVGQINAGTSDAYGSGALRLAGVSCAEGTPADCDRAAVIFTAILGPDGQTRREVLVFWVDLPADGSQPFESLWDGIVLDHESDIVFETGGELFDLGTVFVLD